MTRHEFDLAKAVSRYGSAYVAARLKLQAERAASVFSVSRKRFHVENVEWLHDLIRIGFRGLGLYGWAHRQYLDVQVVEHEFALPNLPDALDGFRILHLSDLHIDLDPALTDVLLEKLPGCCYDVCVLTGDYRNLTHGGYQQVEQELSRLLPAMTAPIYAVLGNHDYLEMTTILERNGVNMLINSNVTLEYCGAPLGLAGVDEPNVYMLDNLQRALEGIPADAPGILLSHSAAIYQQAEAMGVDILLSGHTHGGQLCLPGGLALISNDSAPRKMVRGHWRHGELQGYTSPGTGACALPLRTFCPPEMTLHCLRKEHIHG